MRSVSSINYQKGASIATLENVMQRYPLPVKKGAKKEEKKKDTPAEPKIPETETNEEALAKATTWNNAAKIANKFSIGTLTTAKYQEKVQVFEKMNNKAKDVSALFPLQNYYGQTPDPERDPYNRRQVKQLNDISFDESESGDEEFENIKNVKRMPQTVLTEENMKVYLTKETEKLNLEHSYWMKDTFIDKVGRMAPNLKELSLRRLKISNRAFHEIALHLKQLEIIDISDCPNIQEGSMKVLLDNNY